MTRQHSHPGQSQLQWCFHLSKESPGAEQLQSNLPYVPQSLLTHTVPACSMMNFVADAPRCGTFTQWDGQKCSVTSINLTKGIVPVCSCEKATFAYSPACPSECRVLVSLSRQPFVPLSLIAASPPLKSAWIHKQSPPHGHPERQQTQVFWGATACRPEKACLIPLPSIGFWRYRTGPAPLEANGQGCPPCCFALHSRNTSVGLVGGCLNVSRMLRLNRRRVVWLSNHIH